MHGGLGAISSLGIEASPLLDSGGIEGNCLPHDLLYVQGHHGYVVPLPVYEQYSYRKML